MADLASVLRSLESSLDDADAPTWPANVEAAAFATTMQGAMLQLRQGAPFGEGGIAVVTGGAGMGGELAVWPASTGGLVTPAALDAYVASFIPGLVRCGDDGGAVLTAVELGGRVRLVLEGSAEAVTFELRLLDADVRRSVTVTVIFRRSSPHQTQSGTDIGYTTDNRGRGYGGNSSTPQAYYALTRIMGDRLMAHTHTGGGHRQSTAHAINR
jgi:hypothetical protein